MSGAHIQGQVSTPYGMDQSVESRKKEIRMIMIKQEYLFKCQVRELHALYKKQLELMHESRATMIGQTQEQFDSTGELVKNPNCDLEGKKTGEIAKVRIKVAIEQDATVTPTIMNSSMAKGKQVDQARSIAEKLDLMSSSSLRGASDCLLWFANVVTSVYADDLAIGQKNEKEMQSPSQHGKFLTPNKDTYLKPSEYVVNWGRINKRRRTRRVRSEWF